MDNNFAQINAEIAVRAGIFGPLEIDSFGGHINRYAGLESAEEIRRAADKGIQALPEFGLNAVLTARVGRASTGPCETCWTRAVIEVKTPEGRILYPAEFGEMLKASPQAMSAIKAEAEIPPRQYCTSMAWMMEDWALRA